MLRQYNLTIKEDKLRQPIMFCAKPTTKTLFFMQAVHKQIYLILSSGKDN